MSPRLALATLALALSVVPATAAPPESAPPRRSASPAAARLNDLNASIEGGNVFMRLTNLGSFAADVPILSSPGFIYPKGSGQGVLFAAGVWLGASVGLPSVPRVTVAEYVSEYQPGTAVGGIPESPLSTELRVFKLFRTYANTALRDADLLAWNNYAVPRGAPAVQVLADGSLSTLGDQMTYSVSNDLDHTLHVSDAGGTSPMQVELQQTTWTYNRPAPTGQAVFIRFRIVNRGPINFTDMRVSVWVDPDLGMYLDDVLGSDPSRGLGYCYNGASYDQVYGFAPPAVGVDLLSGPQNNLGTGRLPLTAFVGWTSGADPVGAGESLNFMRGKERNGASILDPQNNPTTFMYSGDPVNGTGWIDEVPSDKRMILSSGPITLADAGARDFTVALIVAQGADALASVALLKQYSDQIQAAYDAGQLDLLDAPTPALPSRLLFSGAFPNPAHGRAALSVSLASESDADVEVLDLAGRRVAGLRYEAVPAGPQRLPMPEEATELPSGVYLLRFTVGAETVVRRWVVLK